MYGGVQPAVQNILMSNCLCRISKSSKWLTLKILQGKLIREFNMSRKLISMKFDLNKEKNSNRIPKVESSVQQLMGRVS